MRLFEALLIGCFSLVLFANRVVADPVKKTAITYHRSDILERLLAWKKLVKKNKSKPESEKLKLVNNFFNEFTFKSDKGFVGREDYWMTPLEFVEKGAGECEDFAIAKYFTLRALGVPTAKMRITYVKSVKLLRSHMVLSYFPEPSAVLLVLDNVMGKILLATQRQDLVPVYSFNAEGLWLARRRGQGGKVERKRPIIRWQGLIERLKREGSL